jgi:hypothetical protein
LNGHNLTKKPAARQTCKEKTENCLFWTVDRSRPFCQMESMVSPIFAREIVLS